MFDLRCFPWIRGPAPTAIPRTDKQEQDQSMECLPPPTPLHQHHMCPMTALSALCFLLLVTCIALSVMSADQSSRRPKWKNLLFDCQNITENYFAVTSINSELERSNEILKDHNADLEEEIKLLNRTRLEFASRKNATVEGREKIMEVINNLTRSNSQLAEEYGKVVQRSVQQEEALVNMSRTLADLSTFSSELQLGKQKVEENNKVLQEDKSKFQAQSMKETQKLQRMMEELRGENQNMSYLTAKCKAKLDQYEEKQKKMEAELQLVEEAYHTLDRYCPVINQNTQERVCRKCEEGWALFQTKCYFFSSLSLSWSSSRAWCQTHGADLVIINTEEEQRFIHEASCTDEQTNTRLWMGVSDIEEEGEWCWVDGRQVATGSQYWLHRPGGGTEPDDWRAEDPEGEDCGHIDTSEEALQSWMDGSCKTSYRWICERNV